MINIFIKFVCTMKRIYYLCFILLAITACQEDPLSPYDDAKPNFTGDTFTPGGGGGGGGTTSGTFTATVDGNPWSAATINAIAMGSKIMVTGNDKDLLHAIGITFPKTITPGTYNFGLLTQTAVYSYTLDPMTPTNYQADGPALEIVQIDTAAKKVKGIFYFTGYNQGDSVNVTNGQFDVTYKPFEF